MSKRMDRFGGTRTEGVEGEVKGRRRGCLEGEVEEVVRVVRNGGVTGSYGKSECGARRARADLHMQLIVSFSAAPSPTLFCVSPTTLE